MQHQTQVRLIRDIFEAMERGTPPLAERFSQNEVSVYTSPAWAARERAALFLNSPLIVGFSSQVQNPGDFLTEDYTPVPIVVVRTADGELRAFANVCRHRGAKLVAGCGDSLSRFNCPYHGWSYDLEGRLRIIPDEYGFEGLDRETHGLMSLPVAEKYGLVWVRPTPGPPLHIDTLLGGLGADLDSYGIASFVPQETRVLRRQMNWKLVSDTFWEAYHIKVLHTKNVAPLFVRNLALFDAFGRNHRFIGVRNSVEKLRSRPEAKWDLLPHATILMNLFPNTVYVMQSDHTEVYRIFPVGNGINESVTMVSILAPAPGPQWARTMDLLIGVVEQDFAIGESIQRSFESGAISHVNYGRFEQALAHFHYSIRAAIEEEHRS
jgi:phenylpropionate dioxygenase-like ring-hydroxylating dioxygenase large terminal subunit